MKRKLTLLLSLLLVMALLLSACGKGESLQFEEEEEMESNTQGETAIQDPDEVTESEEGEAAAEDEGEGKSEEVEYEYETFFSVEEYDYTQETDPDLIAYFDGDIGSALTKLAPAAKAVAYAAYCHPEDMVGAPQDNMLWSAIYAMVDLFHQLPEGTTQDAEGRTVIHGAQSLQTMVNDMFTANVGTVGTPHEDYLDSLIYYDAAAGTYTFEPSGGEGMEIRICALELGPDGKMGITIQIYNSIFDFTSWVSLTIDKDAASAYGYTVSEATAWSEDE
ncbi:MAG: hypothetical protein IKZ21_00650 [Clostridia bacterium]|nr:hypothetical protein [Clostridia bacterium]